MDKEDGHLRFVTKYTGFKSNDEIGERLSTMFQEGLKGLKGITEKDDLKTIEEEEAQHFQTVQAQNPVFDPVNSISNYHTPKSSYFKHILQIEKNRKNKEQMRLMGGNRKSKKKLKTGIHLNQNTRGEIKNKIERIEYEKLNVKISKT